MIEEKKRPLYFYHPKHNLAGHSGHMTKGTDEIFHSDDIEKWVSNYFEENPSSDGIQIVMQSETSFTINHYAMTFYMR